MWDNICEHNIFRRTNETASQPTVWNGNTGHLDGYEAL